MIYTVLSSKSEVWNKTPSTQGNALAKVIPITPHENYRFNVPLTEHRPGLQSLFCENRNPDNTKNVV